jgi:hypothetical protein
MILKIPWTIKGATDLLKNVYARSSNPFYITIDVGPQCCKKDYIMPDYEKINKLLSDYNKGIRVEKLWLGPESAYKRFYEVAHELISRKNEGIKKIIDEMNKYPYMFANNEDGDPYNWLKKLGCWSPIIHLQQTDGTASAHRPFTDEYNKTGIIDGRKVLEAIAESYEHTNQKLFSKKCKEIYLTVEVFSGTGAMPTDIIKDLGDTVNYWREFVPKDGLELDKLLDIDEEDNFQDKTKVLRGHSFSY